MQTEITKLSFAPISGSTYAPESTKRRRTLKEFARAFICEKAKKEAQKKCSHEMTPTVELLGKVGPPQMHPHPLFRDRIQVRLQPLARVSVCFLCEKVITSFGHNEIPVDAELPGLIHKTHR